jgi:hypothetical protein
MMSAGENLRSVHQGTLCQFCQLRYLAANRKDLGEGNYRFCIQNIFSMLQRLLTCRKILRHGANDFPPSERKCAADFYLLKNPSPRPGF